MTFATALVSQQNLPRTFEDFARHLRVTSCPPPAVIIDQQPGVGAQFTLALMHLGFASVLIWHGLQALPAAVHDAGCRRLDSIPRSTLVARSVFGLFGWAWAITVTILFIGR